MNRLSVPDLLEENADLKKALNAERALADDLAEVLASVVVEYEPNEASRVLARYRKARA